MSPTPNSRPETTGRYKPLSPFTDDDDDTTFANNLLCPRYAENDPTSAPPSPTSWESFDVLDSIPWRRSYISLDAGAGDQSRYRALVKRYRKHRAQVLAIVILLTLLMTGCALGGYMAYTQSRDQVRETCIARNGGDRCEEIKWAKCIARNGLGYCEGYM